MKNFLKAGFPIFDSHMHIEEGLSKYDLKNVQAYNVIFNTIESYKQNRKGVPANSCLTLIFDFCNNYDFVLNEIKKKNINALKIHSRLQKIKNADYDLICDQLHQVKNDIPLIIDAFYFGNEMEFQPSLEAIIMFAKKNQARKIVVAHAGGYQILKYFFHLRDLKNIYYDLSVFLQYLTDSSCRKDLLKLIKFTDKSRILYGSDFPFASPKYQFNELMNVIEELGLSNSDKEKIFYNNSASLFH